MTRLFLLLAVAYLHLGVTACSTTPLSESRTEALQNRQDRMNSRADANAERRQIRSDNMDARTARSFDAL